MNWDRIEGRWKQLRGSLRERWGRLTDDHLDQVAGKRDKLLGRIQEAYGITREQAELEVEDWERRQASGSDASTPAAPPGKPPLH